MRTFFKRTVVYLLKLESQLILRKYQPKVVAVTGSVGKTSAKDAIFCALSQKYHVRKSEKSFNSEIGLPLTILGAPNAWGNPLGWIQNLFDGFLLWVLPGRYPQWLVLEVGADRPGDIRSLAQWLKVDVAVITRLPEVPVHVEFFSSPEEVIEEKAALIDALRPGGTLVLYGDDEKTRKLEHRLPAPDARILFFGFGDNVDVQGRDLEFLKEEGKNHWPIGTKGLIHYEGTSVPLSITGALGSHTFLPALAAAAVGVALDMQLPEIVEGVESYDPPPGRMRILPGLKDTFIIDDTYNASPAATTAALETLGVMECPGRRIAVVGDMLELGRHSVDEHRKLGKVAAENANILITVGFRARDIAQGALDNGMPDANIFQAEDARKAGKELESMMQKGDCILVKGSQTMRLERLVEEIMLEPERAKELLVRQDEEWRKR